MKRENKEMRNKDRRPWKARSGQNDVKWWHQHGPRNQVFSFLCETVKAKEERKKERRGIGCYFVCKSSFAVVLRETSSHFMKKWASHQVDMVSANILWRFFFSLSFSLMYSIRSLISKGFSEIVDFPHGNSRYPSPSISRFEGILLPLHFFPFLQFPSFKIVNKTQSIVAFRILCSSSDRYAVHPARSIIAPLQDMNVQVKRIQSRKP